MALVIESITTFIPQLNYMDYPEELQSYQVPLQPSQTASNGDMEGGAPVSLLEAQAAKIPVVATRHADIPTYVLDGKTGLLAQEKGLGIYKFLEENR